VSPSDEPGPEESDDAPVSAAQAPDSTAEPAPDEPAAGGGNRKILLISAAVVVVLVVAGVVIYLVTRGDSVDTASGPDVPSIENPNEPSSVGPARPPGEATGTITAPPSSPSAAAPAGDAGAAQDVAKQPAQAITDSDLKTLGELSCDPGTVNPDDDTFPADAKVEVVGDPEVNGDTATVKVKVMIAEAPPATVPMPLVKQDGRWCIPN
jgi:hypothetical protein